MTRLFQLAFLKSSLSMLFHAILVIIKHFLAFLYGELIFRTLSRPL